jgi:HAMP domain-containing protein
MGGRGLATAALLILVALTCIAIAKRLEGERRMIRRLRELRAGDGAKSIPLEGLDDVERDTLDRLRAAGVVRMDRSRGYINPEALRTFRGKRMRFALTGGLLALLLAMTIAYIVLH